jgi:hypothetical protein
MPKVLDNVTADTVSTPMFVNGPVTVMLSERGQSIVTVQISPESTGNVWIDAYEFQGGPNFKSFVLNPNTDYRMRLVVDSVPGSPVTAFINGA